MPVQVYIPTPFRRATKNQDRLECDARDVQELLDFLEEQFGGLRGLVRNDRGEVHDHVNIYVNSEAIEDLQGLETPLKDGDEVTIIPALAGGSSSRGASALPQAGPPRGEARINRSSRGSSEEPQATTLTRRGPGGRSSRGSSEEPQATTLTRRGPGK